MHRSSPCPFLICSFFLWAGLADTTLLVTDIEDSTVLWEALDAAVMDKTLKLHHACVRQCMRQHNVYEVATEGVSMYMSKVQWNEFQHPVDPAACIVLCLVVVGLEGMGGVQAAAT
jgi:class 3 adenylate cyclase